VALFALDAEVEVATLDERDWMPIPELYESVGVCTIDPCVQMVTALRFRPLPPRSGSDFQRLARRKTLVLPIVNAAAVVAMDSGSLKEVRIAVGPVAPTPFRATRAEEALRGRRADHGAIVQAAALAAEDARPRSSLLRGSSEYRTSMVEVLVRRALMNAVAWAGAA
jgi:carbon-monoxide dehydrogenase medium subunit